MPPNVLTQKFWVCKGKVGMSAFGTSGTRLRVMHDVKRAYRTATPLQQRASAPRSNDASYADMPPSVTSPAPLVSMLSSEARNKAPADTASGLPRPLAAVRGLRVRLTFPHTTLPSTGTLRDFEAALVWTGFGNKVAVWRARCKRLHPLHITRQ